MAESIIAHDAQPEPAPSGDLEHVGSVAARVLGRVAVARTRLEKGWAIYSEHTSEIIASYSCGVWLIPSQSNGTSLYEVRLGRSGATCECSDHEFHPEHRCKHQIAARYAAANSDFCSFCGSRFHYAHLWELPELEGFVCEECA